MDPLFLALSLYRRRHFDKCIEVCTDVLDKQPLDKAAFCLKMRAITQRVYVDDIETEEFPETDFLDDHALAVAPRPGTSLKTTEPTSKSALHSRPLTSTGRQLTGVARPDTQGRPGTALDRAKTGRVGTAKSSRAIRLGTAAIYSQKDGPFIQASRLNLSKYAKDSALARPLFEYLFYHDGDVRNAMELTVQATQYFEFKDWWWKVQLAKCYLAVNLIREAEQQLRSSLKQHYHIETFIRLTRVYVKLDQPLSAMEVCTSGLEIFPNDVTLLTELGRLSEALNDTSSSVKYYRNVVIEDAINSEAIACIGMYHFYNNQPELALRYYRRILVMGGYTAELYNNLGLCCLYSQQLDLTYACFQRALDLAVDANIKAEVWYNLSHVAIAAGDIHLAIQCLNLCISSNSSHAPAFNNLAVLHYKMGRKNLGKAYFSSARSIAPSPLELQINLDRLQDEWNVTL